MYFRGVEVDLVVLGLFIGLDTGRLSANLQHCKAAKLCAAPTNLNVVRARDEQREEIKLGFGLECITLGGPKYLESLRFPGSSLTLQRALRPEKNDTADPTELIQSF